ncbi:hypothetical protein AB9F47_29295 [Rhizobium leguminosarum]|uniref:hypothetical protein n=1 Tax=Rhizobium leguminosarum TaxID=384 RepID=UPI003F9BC149
MGKIDTKIFRLSIPGVSESEVSCELVGRSGNTYRQLKISSGSADSIDFTLVDAVHDDDLDAGLVQFNLDLSVAETRERFAQHGLIGLKFAAGVELRGIRIAVRSADRPSGYTPEHPFFALYLDWVVTAVAADGTQWSNGSAVGEVQLSLPLTTGFACVRPPNLPDISIDDLNCRLDLDGIVVTTGWLPLSFPDLAITLPQIGAWFGWLAGIDLSVPLPDWNVELPLIPTVPLGVGFRTAGLTLEKIGDVHRLTATAETLQLRWKGETVLEYQDFQASLGYDGARYALVIQLIEAHYPADGVSTDPDELSLPFGALGITCACWRFRFGLFADMDANGETHLCPEFIVEIGGLSLGSRWAKKPLWQAKAIRLHLRGTSVLTCKATSGDLFAGVTGAAFDVYRLPLTGHGLTELWSSDDALPAEDPRIEFIDGSFDRSGLLTIMWKQDNDRVLHAILKSIPWIDKQTAEPAAGAKTLVALQFARFDADRQLRLEWRPEGPAPVTGTESPQPPAGSEVCAVVSGEEIVLLIPPATSGGAPAGPITDPDFRVTLPGVTVALAIPQLRSLLFYETAGKWSVSLLHGYDETARTVASASFNAMRFLTPGPSEAGQDSLPAMPGNDSKPFAAAHLASDGSRWQALAMLSWTDGEMPRVLQAFEGDSTAFTPLYPDNAGAGGGDCDGCPGEAAKPQPVPLPLPPARFSSPGLDPARGWRFDMAVQAANDLFSDKGSTIGPVKIAIDRICRPADVNAFDLHARLNFDVLGNKIEGTTVLRLDLGDMSVRLRDKAEFPIKRRIAAPPPEHLAAFKLGKELRADVSEPLELLGTKIYLVRTMPVKGNETLPVPTDLPFLRLTLEGGRFLVELNEGTVPGEVYRAFVVSEEIGILVFEVGKFGIGSGGLDLSARLLATQIKVGALNEPFLLNDASLEIAGNRMRHLSIGATGKLPELLSSAPIRLAIGLKQEGSKIVLDELVCELADKDKPIVTGGVRFRFEISQLELRYRKTADREKLFFFEVSGKAQFEPEWGEFDGKILENLRTATIEFNRAPLSDELIEHVELSVELREPVVFDVFNVFRMEIRSLGFHPRYDFSGIRDKKRVRPALIVGGQCLFADTGDVISAEIDFHKLYIGMPADGSVVPQIEFKDLRVEVQAADGFRLGGSVVSIDEPTRKGFKGDGVITIPGLPELGAAVGFMELRRADDVWVRAWFIAIEASKISYQIPPLPIYLRQIGGGLGVRMFPVIMQGIDEDQPLTKTIERMNANIDAHITLARQESWFDKVEEPGEPAQWVVALEAALTLGTTQGQGAAYDKTKEEGLRTIVVQLLGAMRSDLTMVTAMRVWLPISVDDYFNDIENMHQRPLVKGFILYSPRQQRLLAYATKGKNVYYGKKGDKLAALFKLILDPMPFEFVALIEPNRVRGEIGWVDRLVFSLDLGLLTVECRGGILFAIERRMIVHGIYFSARGKLGLRGGAGGGSLGLRLVAEADVKFATRLLVGQHMLLPLPAGIYGQVGISINVVLAIQAWLHIDAKFFSIDIDIEFPLTIQLLLTLELGLTGTTDLGFKGYARVGISIFGRTLSARIAVGLNEGAVGNARTLMEPFLSSILEPGKVPPIPGEISAPTLASAPSALSAAIGSNAPGAASNSEPFAFSVIEAGSAGGVPRWVIWIMPTPQDGVFYPVPAPGLADYATITGLVAQGATLKVFDQQGDLVSVDNETATIVVHADRRFDSKDAPKGVTLSLRTLLAGSYTADNAGPGFPFDIGDTLPELHSVALPPVGAPLVDDRVALGPRHADPDFNVDHPYDKALSRDTSSDDMSPGAQALGNQAFLMQWLQDGVKRLAGDLASGRTPRSPVNAAALANFGMVVVAEGSLPDWATKRDLAIARPGISFAVATGFAVEHTMHSCPLQPLVEPDRIRFKNGVKSAYRPIAHFDDDLLALTWDTVWENPLTQVEVAPGIGTEVRDYLQHYHVEIFDVGRIVDKPLFVRDVLPLPRLTTCHSLPPPYSLTVPTAELFPPQLRDAGVKCQVLVVIKPVSQAGDEGEAFTATVQLRPSLTPLPPEDAEIELRFRDDRLVGLMKWSQPPIPSKPGIAFPRDWEIIVRQLPQIPIGHYPQATAAVGESEGRMVTDRTCRPGDLIMRVSRETAQMRFNQNDKKHGPDGRELFELSLPANGVRWFDYNGKPIDDNHDLAAVRDAFRSQKSEIGWQLFIRTRAAGRPSDDGSDATYSSMSAVRLYAHLENKSSARPQRAASAADTQKNGEDRIVLGHLEWPPAPVQPPAAPPSPDVARLRRPTAVMGSLHVPLPVPDSDEPIVEYVGAGDARRAVTVSWSGFWDATAPLARLAGFRILEAPDETMLNADVTRTSPDFQPVWTEITRFDATDPEIAGQSPASLADTKNWQAWPPALARILRSGPPKDDPPSEILKPPLPPALVWPPELERSAFPPLPPRQLPLADGSQIAGRRLHAALDWFLGELDLAVAEKGWALTAATGKPLSGGASIADWMDGNTEVDDPQGWAALWQLGLGVELSARHATTGKAVDQASLLDLVKTVFLSLRNGPSHPAWARIRNHLALDLPTRAADALLAKSGKRSLTEIALDRLQVSLRPIWAGDPSPSLPAPLEARIKSVDWPWHKYGDTGSEALPEAEKAKASERYANWARRFVAASPVGERSDGDGPIFDANNTTTIAPLAATVEALCADAGGEYRFTREINQQWAMSRLVRVAVEQRYDRLLEAMTGKPTGATDDWTFESVGGYIGNRVRRLEPPQLISERLVKQQGGPVFHEVVFARHAEAALSASNLPSYRQLQYVGTERRYQRSFYDGPWAAKLDLRPRPRLSTPPVEEIDEAWSPAFPEDTEFLGAVPTARFGALAFLTPAEAFLYDTQLDVRARAIACKSAIVRVPMGRTKASSTKAQTDPGLVALREHGGTWSAGLQAIYQRWRDALAPDDPVLPSLTPRDHRISIRFPRYFESLAGDERRRENVAGTVAMLPDGGATLQFSVKRIGMEETFAAVRAGRGSQGGAEPFVLIQTGPDVEVYELGHSHPGDWWDGLQVEFRAGLDRTEVRAPAAEGRPRAPSEPCTAAAWRPGCLPGSGPLARAAPIALRLATPGDATARLTNPFPIALGMARPLTQPEVPLDPAVLAGKEDLGFGIRLLLDPERLAAAVAYGLAPQEEAPLDLAEAIETAPAAVLRRHCPAIDATLWDEMKDSLAIWILTDATDEIWTPCGPDDPPPGVGDALIVAATTGAADWRPALTDFLAHAGDDGDPERTRLVVELEALTLIAQRLAAAALEPLDKPEITAWVQRENKKRELWGEEHG